MVVTAAAVVAVVPGGPTGLPAADLPVTVAWVALAVGLVESRRRDHSTRRRWRVVAKAVSVATAVAVMLALVAAVQALPQLRAGLRTATAAMAAAGRGEAAPAREGLTLASEHLATAHDTLSRWWARPALAVPLVGPQLRTARTMADSGAELAATGARTVAEAKLDGIRMVDGTVPVDRIAALEDPLLESLESLERAEARLDAVASPWLAPPLRARLGEVQNQVRGSRERAETALLAARVLPALLGDGEPRRYFLAIQNPAEMRATGGIIGNFGEIAVVDGRLELTRTGRAEDLNRGGDPTHRRLDGSAEYLERYRSFHPTQVWQNVNASPDFPTVARIIAELYPQSGGQPVDGVISVDPAGLAAILAVTGPVEVPGWPEPLTAANAEAVLLHEQYSRYPGRERIDFLSDTTHTLWSRLTTGPPPALQSLASALGPAAGQKHFLLWSQREVEQRLFERLGVSGAVPTTSSDLLGVVTQNAGGNKIDWFLRRTLTYRARVDEATGQVKAALDIRLHNDAPATGLPPLVIASSGRARTRPGENRLYLSVYTPWELASAEVDGQAASLESQRELGQRVYSTFLTVPPGDSVVVHLELSGRLPRATPYSLETLEQVTIHPDQISTAVEGA